MDLSGQVQSQGVLPVELLQQILENTESYITVVNFSHACRYFRQVVSPITQWHLSQCLLERELLPKNGEINLLYENGFHPSPGFEDAVAWSKMRYACCGCMKILPQWMFDNHSVLAERFRKPLRGSSDAVSIIEFGYTKTRYAKRQRKKRFRQGANGERRIGRDRIHRRCVSCHHSRGDYKHGGSTNLGTQDVPAIDVRSSNRGVSFYLWIEPLELAICDNPEDSGDEWTDRFKRLIPRTSLKPSYSSHREVVMLCVQCSSFRRNIDFGMMNEGIRRYLNQLRADKDFKMEPVICLDCRLSLNDQKGVVKRLVDFRNPCLQQQIHAINYSRKQVDRLIQSAKNRLSSMDVTLRDLNQKQVSNNGDSLEVNLTLGKLSEVCRKWIEAWQQADYVLTGKVDNLRRLRSDLENNTRQIVACDWRAHFEGEEATREGYQVFW